MSYGKHVQRDKKGSKNRAMRYIHFAIQYSSSYEGHDVVFLDLVSEKCWFTLCPHTYTPSHIQQVWSVVLLTNFITPNTERFMKTLFTFLFILHGGDRWRQWVREAAQASTPYHLGDTQMLDTFQLQLTLSHLSLFSCHSFSYDQDLKQSWSAVNLCLEVVT